MLTTISKTFDFDAAHRLDLLPEDHKCHRLHGHTYRVEIRVRGEPGGRLGMVIDYAVLAKAWAPIHDALDHRYLNEIEGLEVPTTEVLAAWIFDRLKAWDYEVRTESKLEFHSLGKLALTVRVYESATTWAEVGRT